MGESEKTLVFVKPGNEDIAYRVFDYLGELLRLDGLSYLRHKINPIKSIPEELIAEHYRDLKTFDETIFKNTVEAYKNGTIFLSVYCCSILGVRKNIGNTNPVLAEDWTVRGHFRRDSLEEALKQKRYLNNVIHASSSEIEARRELKLWADFLDI